VGVREEKNTFKRGGSDQVGKNSLRKFESTLDRQSWVVKERGVQRKRRSTRLVEEEEGFETAPPR